MDKLKKIDKKEMNKTIGRLLKKHRLSNGYTQEQVAEKLNCDSKYISQIERGISAGTIETLIRFCNLYNITTDAILSPFLKYSIKDSERKHKSNYKKICKRDQQAIDLLTQFYLEN